MVRGQLLWFRVFASRFPTRPQGVELARAMSTTPSLVLDLVFVDFDCATSQLERVKALNHLQGSQDMRRSTLKLMKRS